MTVKELTFDEKYQVRAVLTASKFSVEYAGCGSHEMEITFVTTLEHLQSLHEAIIEINGMRSPSIEVKET